MVVVCTSIVPLSFSVQSPRAYRALHSFPTRRSSDLMAAYQRAHSQWAALVAAYEQRLAYIEAKQAATPAWWAKQEQLARSEEHTSELQSLRHLVCRLLLEKKNSN